MMRILKVYYKPTLKEIKSKEDLVNELRNLVKTYLRLKEEFLVTISQQNILGKTEVKNARRFLLDALTRSGSFVLEREAKFDVNGEIFDQLLYSTECLQNIITSKLDKRGICEEFCNKLKEGFNA